MTDIIRKRGDTYPIELTVVDRTGAVFPVTGGTFKLTADPEKEPLSATNNIFQITGTIVDGPNGVVSFPMTDVTADHVGPYFYDVQMVRGGIKSTLVAAKLTMLQDITKD